MPPENASLPTGRLAHLLCGPLPVALLLACHFALGYRAAWQKSMTFDEGVHLTGGMIYWSVSDFRMHPENGNWSQRVAALPVYLSGTRFVPPEDASWDGGLPWEISDYFLFHAGNDLESMLRRGRAMIGLASVALGLVVYLWSRKLFGAAGGLVSLTLYAFSPAMLANGFLTTSDLLASFFFTASVGILWILLNRVTLLGLVAACFAAIGLDAFEVLGRLDRAHCRRAGGDSRVGPGATRMAHRPIAQGKRFGSAVGIFTGIALVETLAVVAVVWASYCFRYAAFAPAVSHEVASFHVTWEGLYKGLPPYVTAALDVARDHHLLPEAFLFGFGYTLFSGAHQAFLDGVYSVQGSTLFFPSCFAWKTPLSMFVVLALAAIGCRTIKAQSAEGVSSTAQHPWWYPLTPLVALWGIYWITALKSGLNIGHRHILPTYPPLFILAGAAGLWFRSPRLQKVLSLEKKTQQGITEPSRGIVLAGRLMTLGALLFAVADALWTWPNYLAYFNLLSGGPDLAYRRLVDSSLDWGQDLKGLKQWLDAHPEDAADPRRVYLSYFGMAGPQYYGIDVQPLPSFRLRWRDDTAPPPLRAGLYCLSATMVQPVYGQYTGHWNEVYEKLYQTLRTVFGSAIQQGADLEACRQRAPRIDENELVMALRNYEELRFGRLCSFLRQREPDAKVNYSILLYRLTDEDVAAALDGPPCELLARPENQ